jgi:ABC-type enterochelin transport system substrate-binding protein
MVVKVFAFAFFAACLLAACSKDNGKQPVQFSAEETTAVNGQDMPDSLSAEKTDGGNTAPVPLPPQNADIEIDPAVRVPDSAGFLALPGWRAK